MKATLVLGVAAGLVIFAAQAQGGQDERAGASPDPAGPVLEWDELAQGFGGRPVLRPSAAAPDFVAEPPAAELDVVDAHWMALTMWGEARGSGEEAMRAVGHVIDNRRRAGHHGAFVTETVSEAWQFSCWNPGDPNRAAIQGIDRLPRESRDFEMWVAARRIAAEILAERSADPTEGALFYHTADVAPSWSRGMEPARQIGGHLFFRTARRT
ncbi:cell wall hydrolase [Sphingosinicella sp. CPCC 101087]|uniref:cell wall hydrolase n=1 Tax=Sphingosinicella sp. CPCC 101087 TaxID=2497754 RepID=UPI00101BFD1F|nr:cell wall hydrolase [Sphingosinicella sp. CPCC 101087]